MIRTEIKVSASYTTDEIKDAICATLPVARSEIGKIEILKKVLKIDKSVYYALTVGIAFSQEREAGLLKMKKKVSECPDYTLPLKSVEFTSKPLIVGAGPAGLFAALIIAECGGEPTVIERGDPVDERSRSVSRFFDEKILDAESNIQFGEGGAGAFSDGKLKVGGMDAYKYKVLSEFVLAGAPGDVLYTQGAHLGTDKLPGIVANIREKIKSLGGEFIYRAKLTDIIVKDGAVCGAKFLKNGRSEIFQTDTVILATGHSAKDTFEMLLSAGVPMESRPFGIGVRIEHPRTYINKLIYKDERIADTVGTASYHLVTHLNGGRSVYSFCMCPGGTVVAAASENGGVVTNGMSEYARDADNSNAAHLISISREDFGSDSPLAGIELQRKIERAAFAAGGADFKAPAIRMDDFIKNNRAQDNFEVIPSYSCGVLPASPGEYLPEFVTDSLREGIMEFDKWMPGFYYPGASITGAETRSTSPIRILRDENYISPAVCGLYPIGEGAGYSGGIVSSGVDGVKAALSIVNNLGN